MRIYLNLAPTHRARVVLGDTRCSPSLMCDYPDASRFERPEATIVAFAFGRPEFSS